MKKTEPTHTPGPVEELLCKLDSEHFIASGKSIPVLKRMPKLIVKAREIDVLNQRLHEALRVIAKDYRKAEAILRKPEFGLDGEECLEMAYDNIQSLAASAIKGIKKPKRAAINKAEGA